MKLIFDPSVYLIAYSQLAGYNSDLTRFFGDHGIQPGSVAAGEWTLDALPEIAGRLCYMSFKNPRPGGNAAYLEHIREAGHGSVLEHPHLCFIVTGISRSLSHEWVRHRAGWGYSQLSQRYVDESVAEYVVPPALAACVRAFVDRLNDPKDGLNHEEEIGRQWYAATANAHAAYVQLCEHLADKVAKDMPQLTGTELRKYVRSAARSLLPNATETKIFASCNGRAFRHFLEMRASRPAEVEIRKLAVAMYRAVLPTAPNLLGDYTVETLPDGTEALSTPTRKV